MTNCWLLLRAIRSGLLHSFRLQQRDARYQLSPLRAGMAYLSMAESSWNSNIGRSLGKTWHFSVRELSGQHFVITSKSFTFTHKRTMHRWPWDEIRHTVLKIYLSLWAYMYWCRFCFALQRKKKADLDIHTRANVPKFVKVSDTKCYCQNLTEFILTIITVL